VSASGQAGIAVSRRRGVLPKPGQTETVTSVATGVGSGRFVMFKAAMLGQDRTTLTYPVLSIANTLRAATGSKLTMELQGATVLPKLSQLWRLERVPAPTTGGGTSTGGGGSTAPGCSMFACLLG
jgi:hypothetical protein